MTEGKIYGTTFAAIPTWLLDADVSDRAIRLFAKLNRYAGSDGCCNPGRKRLADEMHTSMDSVDRAKAELIEAGALESRPVFGVDGDRTTNDYVLHFDAPVRLPLGNPAPTPLGKPAPTPMGKGAAVKRASPKESQVERDGKSTSSALPQKLLKSAGPPKASAQKKVRAPDLIWDGLLALSIPAPDSPQERSRWNAAVKDLRESEATPAQIKQRGAEYRRRWPKVTLTPFALVSNWGALSVRDMGGDKTNRNPANFPQNESGLGGAVRVQ